MSTTPNYQPSNGTSSRDIASNAADVEAGPTDKTAEKADLNVVDWDGPDDLANPQNWDHCKRWLHIGIVSLLALVTNMTPTMCAPGIDQVAEEFGIESPTVSTLAITLYLLGLGVGPMLISPLSEVYGRLPVYHAANIVFLAFVVGNALSQNVAQFMVFRFISGFAGGTPMALGGGSIADVTSLKTRASAMGLFSLGPLTGPVLGPVIGGFVASSLGWRWTFWLLSIIGGAVAVAAAILMRETHPKVLLERKTARLRVLSGSEKLRSSLARSHLTPNQVLTQALVRPTMLLIRSPVLLIMSLYVALVFGLMYLLMTTFTDVFDGHYGFTTATSGLSYLGLGVALIVAMVVFRTVGSRVLAARMQADGVDRPRPEHRLILIIWFSPFVGLGLFLYGWTAQYQVQWIVPIIGTSLIGFGAFFVLMPTQLYLVDIFGSEAAASALGANNLLRFLSSTFLPLAGPPMYGALGDGWGNTMLGFLALAFLPAPVLFYRFGERLRAKSGVEA
ncbi:MFS general substrate transporter [Apiospora saccharicola]